MKNLSDYTIKEIQALLDILEEPDEELFADLEKDPRKGVHTNLKKKRKYFAKIEEANADRIQKLRFETELWNAGYDYVAGVDEVGRGPLAGPVYAAAVILPKDFAINGINDSKQLSHDKRIGLYDIITKNVLAWKVASASVEEIDELNIKAASRLAMKRAVEGLATKADFVIIDAESIDVDIPQKAIIKGDAASYTIGAASIIAKVARDNVMIEYGKEFPGYGFEKNMGYGTKEHLEGLENSGVTPIHRKTFAPVKKYFK